MCQFILRALGRGVAAGENGRCPQQRPSRVHRPPRLIAQLLSHAAATRGQGLLDVAEAIGVDETTLMQYRSGRRRLSMQSFANILAVYGDDRPLRDTAVHYARVEYHPPKPESMEAAADALSVPTVDTLRAYVDRLPEETVTTGRGLYLHSTDARSLSLAVQFLVRAFERTRVTVCHLRADQRVTASDRRFALAAPLLIVERIDFLRGPIPDLLRERADLVRPLIVTSMQPANAAPDPHLRRLFLSRTRLVDLDPSPSLPTHGPVPAESEQQ
jgi:transcriptional regulator with XRE-family HTH domain